PSTNLPIPLLLLGPPGRPLHTSPARTTSYAALSKDPVLIRRCCCPIRVAAGRPPDEHLSLDNCIGAVIPNFPHPSTLRRTKTFIMSRSIKGYAVKAKGAALEPFEYEPGILGDEQVEIAVDYCGICHSDLSMIDTEWGQSTYPLVPGHEAAGRVVATAEDVST